MMKKVLLSLAIVLLAAGNAFAVPRFMGVDNKNGKTTKTVKPLSKSKSLPVTETPKTVFRSTM